MKEIMKHLGIAFLLYAFGITSTSFVSCSLDIQNCVTRFGILINIIMYMVCYFLHILIWFNCFEEDEPVIVEETPKSKKERKMKNVERGNKGKN